MFTTRNIPSRLSTPKDQIFPDFKFWVEVGGGEEGGLESLLVGTSIREILGPSSQYLDAAFSVNIFSNWMKS